MKRETTINLYADLENSGLTGYTTDELNKIEDQYFIIAKDKLWNQYPDAGICCNHGNKRSYIEIVIDDEFDFLESEKANELLIYTENEALDAAICRTQKDFF